MELWSKGLGISNLNGEWIASIEELVDEEVILVPVVCNIFHDQELLTLWLEGEMILVIMSDWLGNEVHMATELDKDGS